MVTQIAKQQVSVLRFSLGKRVLKKRKSVFCACKGSKKAFTI